MEEVSTRYQTQYWVELTNLITHKYYYDLLAERDELWDRTISIGLALISSGSIATWAIWKEHAILWASIIALSQIVTAIKPYLPFKNRLKALLKITAEMSALQADAEQYWHDVSESTLPEEEINKLRFEKIKKPKIQILNRHFPDGTIPADINILLAKAEALSQRYLKQHYYRENP